MNKKIWFALSAALVVVVALVTSVPSSKPSPNSPASSPKIITFAEGPGAAPNYIFPYMSAQYFSVSNINQFQQLMYRPLYWFGLGNSIAVQPQLSLASQPVFTNSNKTVTITMKGWKFADGQTIDAQSVMFFLNMYKADPKSYAGYNPGYGIPDQLSSVTGAGNTLTLTFKSSVNPNWLLYNYLSEITPFPNSWDVTAKGPSSCATGPWGAPATNTACKAVENYLDNEAASSSTYTNALWGSGVDGPWRLTSFDSLGNATFKPNPFYSGPQKATVSAVKLVAFTSSSAEQNQLLAHALTIGYVDPSVLSSPAPAPGTPGPNWPAIASSYNLVSGTPWSFNYAPFNFSSTNPKSAAIKQLYIRQALQESLDQVGIIKNVDKGYGVPTFSPIPPNAPASLSAPVTNPYPYNMAAARALLSSHGWKMINGVQTCVNPGTNSNQCGPGITRGYTLNFAIIWASGSPSLDQTFTAEVSNWATIGIKFSHTSSTFNNVIASCSSPTQPYQICSWGAGWIYAPDYYPSGETLFTTKGGFNPGGYSDPHMNALVDATTFGSANLTSYATYAARQLPVLYQPNPVSITEVSKGLKSSIGFTPNPLANFMPEYYSL